ncbi:P-loop containing nucleoside triphosphate hydrolase protein [Xylariomycetidae sp. FL2044]|nr:P-loop containing nucleoside triphosphate hydrolase protein [Xylariomycetidae sp. FL2044]
MMTVIKNLLHWCRQLYHRTTTHLSRCYSLGTRLIKHHIPRFNLFKHIAACVGQKRPHPVIVLILGPPGAGKGTQCQRLRAHIPGLTHLSYGELLRYEAKNPGSWVSSFPTRYGTDGHPVLPADAATTLLRERVEAGVARGQLVWLIDGFPRSEAHVLAWFRQMPFRPTCALFLHADPQTLVQRILGRAADSGRPDDADPGRVVDRVNRNIAECDGLLIAVSHFGVPVVRIGTTGDADDVFREILRHFNVSLFDDWFLSVPPHSTPLFLQVLQYRKCVR